MYTLNFLIVLPTFSVTDVKAVVLGDTEYAKDKAENVQIGLVRISAALHQ